MENERPVQLTDDELERLARGAVPCTGLTLTPGGDVLIIGRGALAIADTVVRVDPADVATFVHALTMQLLAAMRDGRGPAGLHS